MASATASKGGAGKGALSALLFYVFLTLFVLVSMFPLIWIFKMSIITRSELFQAPPTLLPANPIASEYGQIFSDPAFQQALINSVIISGVTTVICLFFGHHHGRGLRPALDGLAAGRVLPRAAQGP
jgi:multiple sugar transport system permease protein